MSIQSNDSMNSLSIYVILFWLLLRFGFWAVLEFWALEFGFWALEFGFWALEFGFWALVF